MSVAIANPPTILFDFDLKDAIKCTALAADLGVSMEAMRRYRLAGLKTVKCGRQRFTTKTWFHEFLARQSGITAGDGKPDVELSRARAAELAREDAECEAAGI